MRGPGRFGAPLFVALLLTAAVGVSPGLLSGQSSLEDLSEECVGGSAELRPLCEDGALVLQATHGGLGLLTAAGGAVPASPSTAGWRLAREPRVVLDGGLILANFRWPEPGRDGAAGAGRDSRKTLLGARAVTSVGLFEGFSPVPTVGGVLGIDAVGSFRYLRLPSGLGFSGDVAAWGAGVRVGLVRESFSLPGVTVSALHHRVGTVRSRHEVNRGSGEVDEVRAVLSSRVTSVRAEVGKDLLALGVTVGGAWDRYGGSGSISARRAEGDLAGATLSRDLRMERTYLFLGVNFTWVVVQAAGELTWAGAPSPLGAMEGSGPVRSDAGSLQGALTLRVTY